MVSGINNNNKWMTGVALPLIVVLLIKNSFTPSTALLLQCHPAIKGKIPPHRTRNRRHRGILMMKSVDDEEETVSSTWNGQSDRREYLFSSLAVGVGAAILCGSGGPLVSYAGATPPPNPLNLKGSFWETGELYDKAKQQPISLEPEDLLQYCQTQVQVLNSLNDVAIAGKYDELKKLLRGGAMSETRLRKQAYALLDQWPETTQDYYAAEDALRSFFVSWDNLDRTVDGASKLNAGGVVETIGLAALSPYNAANQVARISAAGSGSNSAGGDPGLLVVTALEQATGNLDSFVRLAKKSFPVD